MTMGHLQAVLIMVMVMCYIDVNHLNDALAGKMNLVMSFAMF
jgi:hypothetical protein